VAWSRRMSSSPCSSRASRSPPARSGCRRPKGPQSFQYTLNIAGRLDDAEQFENVIVKTGDKGEIIRVRDVGSVELGAQTYGQVFTLNGKPAAGMAIFQSPGANALDVANVVKDRMTALE
jgi:hydrophobic/amphiphilic exporter-1 (mainly G- bacteria), HAE1 family